MAKIRTQLQFLTAISICTSAMGAYFALQTRDEMQVHDQAMNDSLETRSILLLIPDLPYKPETYRRLQIERDRLKQPERKDAFDLAIHAYAEKNESDLRYRIRRALKVESEYYQQNRGKNSELEQNLKTFSAIVVGALLMGIFLVLFVVNTTIFKTLNRLSRRMMDFLVDRYSFQFSQADDNELGDLQRTFNSLAQKVINTMDDLKQLDQAKSDFLSIASHELRTPMTSIKGSLALLSSGVSGPMNDSSRRLIQIAEGETDRLIRLINDLLDLAKIEAGHLPLELDWVAWDSFCQTTLEGLSGLAHNATVRFEQLAVPGVEVHIDADRLQQVLTNLVSNAVKFSPKGGTVRVSLAKSRTGELVVGVHDQGPGIAAEHREVIFEKFRQASNQKNPLVKGTGLGLAIAKAIVEEHGGTIGVDSSVGEGSTFWFTLPKWREASGPTSLKKPEAA